MFNNKNHTPWQCLLQAPHLWYEGRMKGQYNAKVMKCNKHTHSRSKLRSQATTQVFHSILSQYFYFSPIKSQQDGTVGYWLDNPGFKSQHRQDIFSSPKQSDQLFSPPSFIFKGYQGSFPGVKLPGCEADHSHLFSAAVTNEWSKISTHVICLHGMGTGNCTLFLRMLKKEHSLATEFSFSWGRPPPTFTLRKQSYV